MDGGLPVVAGGPFSLTTASGADAVADEGWGQDAEDCQNHDDDGETRSDFLGEGVPACLI